MQTPLQLQIPQPCHENWDTMIPEEKGRFCLNCQKTVVDFSVMSDRQVLEYFTNFTGSTCGRFAADQLNRQITSVDPKRKTWYKYVLSILMPAFMLGGRAESQERLQGDTVYWAPVDTVKKPVGPRTVGRVKAKEVSKPEPAPEALFETLTGTMGMVATYKEPASGVIIGVRCWIKDTLARIFPNPVRSGAEVRIEMKLEKGLYLVQVIDVKGEVVQDDRINVAQEQFMHTFRLRKHLPFGQYMVALFDKRRKRLGTYPLIIQK